MRHQSNTAQRLMCGAAAIAILAAAPVARAEERAFTIAPQSLSTALAEFGAQSGHAVMAPMGLLGAKTSHGFSQSAEPEIALTQLLDGTGLTYRKTGDTFAIVEAADPQSGSAAGDGADAGTVQALIVTAQKREENIQDVPIAMSAFTQEDLTRSQVAGGPDLMTQVPNFTFTKTNFSSYSIQIRGIGTQAISATTDAAVAVAFNNTPFIRNRFFEQEFYDLARVEVLRGPQGTLYGRNATAGVVNVISQKPKFAYESKFSADVGNYNSTRFEGMLNIPLVDDKVALRVAGAWTKRDGYDVNQVTGNRIDGRDLWSTRVSLRFTPTERLDANLIWEHFEENDDRLRSGKQLCHKDIKRSVSVEINGQMVDVPVPETGSIGQNGQQSQSFFSQGCAPASLYSPDSFETPNGYRLPFYGPLAIIGVPVDNTVDPYLSATQSRDLRVIESTVDPKYKAETNTVELQVSYDLTDTLKLTSETGYNSDELFSSEDYNRFQTTQHQFHQLNFGNRAGVINSNGEFCDPQIGCADHLVGVDLSTARSKQFSEELRLASDFEGPFNFSLGANFLRYDTEDKYYVFFNTLSLYAAMSPYSSGQGPNVARGPLPPYVPNQTDNHECMKFGIRYPNLVSGESVEGCIYMDPNGLESLNDQGHNYFLSRNPYKLISYALFGESYYQISPTLKLTAGLRWTVDKKNAPRIPSWVLASDSAGYPVAEVIKLKWSEPTGRLTLDWKPDLSFTDETLLYASIAHGYKAGGSNPPSNGFVMHGAPQLDREFKDTFINNQATHPKTFGPEFVNAFEVGWKNTLLGGDLTLNGDAFYYDYTGYQISYIVDRSAVNLNFDAKVWGLELETDWRPIENLRLGLKLGYEKTRMADGSQAVDLMDRTAGHTDWFVTAPFPTMASNCILPTYVAVNTNTQTVFATGDAWGGGLGPCELAYVLGVDPITGKTYTANPTSGDWDWYAGYKGFDPSTAPNGGVGFYKDLSGHELPNAPHYTATLTADYTIPLPSDWLMTLHSDLYYQSEAWTRVFNDPGYDKLKAYTNVNVAAIFSNGDAGWKVMAYVKNIFDKDNITGAFLNSDDTGLTTNVFLNEPRLYGLRVTKEWNGGPWWTGANPDHAGPYPLTIEVAGQVQHQEAPFSPAVVESMADVPAALALPNIQNRQLDWGDGRSVKLTYRPDGSAWSISGAIRYGRTNNKTTRANIEIPGDKVCGIPTTGPFGAYGKAFCDPTYSLYGFFPAGYFYNPFMLKSATNWSQADARNHEEHLIVDFAVGHDVGMGTAFAMSRYSVGIRQADFESKGDFNTAAVNGPPLEEGWYFPGPGYIGHTAYDAHLNSKRDFKGVGPELSWDAGTHLLGSSQSGHLDLDWSVTGGILFGKQKVSIRDQERTAYYYDLYLNWPAAQVGPADVIDRTISRSKSVSVPVLDLSLGLSYDIQRIKVSTGYRWERYFNVLDGGFEEHKSYDRTIDGPYFKIAVGFGG